MNTTHRSFATLFICAFSLCSISIASAQQRDLTNSQSSVSIVTATASTESTPADTTPSAVSGTANKIVKWLDNAGTLGDSNIFESASGNIGFGTTTPNTQSLFHLHKQQNSITTLFASNNSTGNQALVSMRAGLDPTDNGVNYMSLNMLGTNWSTGVGASFFKARTGLIESSGSNFGIGNLSNTEPIIFYTTSGRAERMRIEAGGNIGIGVTTPTAKLHVNGNVNVTGLRTENTATIPNVIGGESGNTVTAGVFGATIGGGGNSNSFPSFINGVTDDFGTVGGGLGNTAGNNAGTTSDKGFATVGGGAYNTASGTASIVGGGDSNVASGRISTIAGGESNTASGIYSTVPGGVVNTAQGDYSFAAGRRARALHQGSLVWSDSTIAEPNFFSSTGNNQFLINATGGVGIGTNAPLSRLHVVTSSTNATDNTATFSAPNIGANFSHIHYGTLGDWVIRSAASAGNVILQDTGGNVGVGTNAPKAKLHVANGNVFIAKPNSLIITSPNGSCWFIKVSDRGLLSTVSVTCP